MNNQQIKAFALSRREEVNLKTMPQGEERKKYLDQINFRNRISSYVKNHCPTNLLQPYVCPVSKARYDNATYADKLIEVIMKKAQGTPFRCELAVGKELGLYTLRKTRMLFHSIPALVASVRTVKTSGNRFIVVNAVKK